MIKSHAWVLVCAFISFRGIMTGLSTGRALNQRFITNADMKKNTMSPKNTAALAVTEIGSAHVG
jgi:hypothetical protein